MHNVVIVALDGVLAFDLATPVEIFGRVVLPDGQPGYNVRVCAPSKEVRAGPFTMRLDWGLEILAEADTIILPGLSDPFGPVSDKVLNTVQQAAQGGARVASICVGAFTLAATGLLDGQRATTHWAAAHQLARLYPRVTVDADVLFVDNGATLTSAGAAAGLDLCLHLVRRDYGAAVAADAARVAVMPLERDGGQAQFIVHPQPNPEEGATLEPLLRWMTANAHRELTLEELADHAGMSSRTLSRRFRQQTGTTPLQWLHHARLLQAQSLLETTGLPIERVAAQVGFGSATTFRDRFKAFTGVSPQGYRRTFQSTINT